MEQMTNVEQERAQEQKQQNEIREALRIVGMIRLWIDNYPQHAASLAFEMNQLLGRYVHDPTPDIELRVHIPLSVWKQWVECRDVERAETLLLETMLGEIDKRQKGYVPLKTSVPLSMYEQFEKACAFLEGKEVEEEHLPAYVQSVLCKAIQDFVKQHGNK